MLKFVLQHNSIMNWSHIFRARVVELAREKASKQEGFNIGVAFPPAGQQNESDNILDNISQKGIWATGAALTCEPGDCLFVADVQDVDPGPLLSMDGVYRIGMVHGGPHEEWDFTRERGPAYQPLFQAQLKCYDELWVTTTYHSHVIQRTFNITHDKIKVVGLPVDICLAIGKSDHVADEEGEETNFNVPWTDKKDEILFCSRQANDKGYDLAMHLKENTDLPIRIERFTSRRAFYRAIAETKWVLIPSRKETFGVLAAEVAMLGSVPMVPYGMSYPEILTMEWPFYLSEGRKYGGGLTTENIEAMVRAIYERDLPENQIDKHLAGATVRYMEYDELFDTQMFDLFERKP